MEKLTKKLSVTTLVIALMSTVAFANREKESESSDGHKISWQEAFKNAPIASDEQMKEFDLSKTVRLDDLKYTKDSDAPRKEIEDNLKRQAAAAQKLVDNEKTSWSTSLWVKAKLLWTITVSVAKLTGWFA